MDREVKVCLLIPEPAYLSRLHRLHPQSNCLRLAVSVLVPSPPLLLSIPYGDHGEYH